MVTTTVLRTSISTTSGESNCVGTERGQSLIACSLEAVQKQAKNRVTIVMHGTNEFIPEITAKCIERGVTRINVNKMVLSDYFEYTNANTGKVPLTTLLEKGTSLIQAQCESWMDHIGCSGKADESR